MKQSENLFKRAKQLIPGGVNSPVRAFNAVGGNPIFFNRGQGAYLFDEDGKQYTDYVSSWGPLILGHAHPAVIETVQSAVQNGLGFGASTALEVELANEICRHVPSIEQVRLVNSGTEATMTAIRLARGFTGRDKIIKFEGCYHGHADSLLVKAGSGALTFGTPSSSGVPASLVQHTLVATFNDIESVKTLFSEHGKDIAAIIIEPVAGNMGCILPQDGFLQQLRELCDKHESLLILDEVITGFRVNMGGAQTHFNVKPDITTLGKIIGGGQPVGAFGGRRDIMQELAPTGPVYQAGTLSGNPIAVSAGLATLKELNKPGVHAELETKTKKLTSGIEKLAKETNISICINQISSMFSIFFTDQKSVTTFADVQQCDTEKYTQFFHGMLEQGFYFAPSAFETAFISTAHTDANIKKTLEAIKKTFANMS